MYPNNNQQPPWNQGGWQQQPNPYQQNPFMQAQANPRAQAMPLLMTRVYQWMTLGLALTGGTALMAQQMDWARDILINGGIFWGLAIVTFLMAVGLHWFAKSLPAPIAFGVFLLYSALMGLSLSPIFIVYELGTISAAFFTTAGMFGSMTIFGYVTKRDLSGWGSFLMMGLWGLIIASIVNALVFGFQNNFLYWLTTYVGVIVFTGLTAYDTQKIKEEAMRSDPNDHSVAIRGALELYLDFINLFLYILRILARLRDS